MKKSLMRLVSVFLATLLLTCGMTQIFPARALNEDFIMDGTTLVCYVGNGTTVVIPPELGVKKIGEGAFAGTDSEGNATANASITSVTVPEGVTEIGIGAFMCCSSLKTVILPLSLTKLCDGVFMECTALETIRIPETTTDIDDIVFYGCTSLTSVNIPQGLTYIPMGMFYSCQKLDNVVLPNSVTTIGTAAFAYCSSLKSIEIPQSVKSIGDSAFMFCETLNTVTVHDTLETVGAIAFYETAWLNNQPDGPVYIVHTFYCYKGETPDNLDLTLREGTYSISEGVFDLDNTLTKITIPDSVKIIAQYALMGCSCLTEISVNAANTVYASRDGVLFNRDVTELIQYPAARAGAYKVPDSVKSIASFAFLGSIITGVLLPVELREINECSFYYCAALTRISIPDSVTHIDNMAFAGCSSLDTIAFPQNLRYVGHGAFDQTVWFNNQPDGLVYINNIAYIYKGEAAENTTVTLKAGTTAITAFAFAGLVNITDIIIPDSVTIIGTNALLGTGWYDSQPEGLVYAGKFVIGYNGDNLVDVEPVIADGTVGIAEGAFTDSLNIVSLTVPDSVIYIGDSALQILYPSFTLKGNRGSYIETYAAENDIPFVYLDGCDHTPGEWAVVTAATCTMPGTKHIVCTKCGEELETDTIPTVPHDADPEWTIDVSSTFTVKGTKSHHCIACGTPLDVTELPLLGDSTGDGKINALDLLRLKLFLAGSMTPTFDQKASADMTGDGKVNALDLLRIKMKLSGKI